MAESTDWSRVRGARRLQRSVRGRATRARLPQHPAQGVDVGSAIRHRLPSTCRVSLSPKLAEGSSPATVVCQSSANWAAHDRDSREDDE